jgi:hypothetical protein
MLQLLEMLPHEIAACATAINEKQCAVEWQLQIDDASLKLKHLHLKIQA